MLGPKRNNLSGAEALAQGADNLIHVIGAVDHGERSAGFKGVEGGLDPIFQACSVTLFFPFTPSLSPRGEGVVFQIGVAYRTAVIGEGTWLPSSRNGGLQMTWLNKTMSSPRKQGSFSLLLEGPRFRGESRLVMLSCENEALSFIVFNAVFSWARAMSSS